MANSDQQTSIADVIEPSWNRLVRIMRDLRKAESAGIINTYDMPALLSAAIKIEFGVDWSAIQGKLDTP